MPALSKSRSLLGVILLLLCFAQAAEATDTSLFSARVHEANGAKLGYRLFQPKNYDPAQKYPLILFLHGSGERGSDNLAQIRSNFPDVFLSDKSQTENPCFLVAPQCPKDASWNAETLSQVKAILDSLAGEFSLDPNRLYVIGISMGGRGVFNILTEYPGLFAAAVPCAGGSDPAQISKMKQTPMWLHCSTRDRSIQHYYDLVAALKQQGEEVVWFKSNRNMSEPNMPWESVVAEVSKGRRFLYCEVLDGYHQDSWTFAWKNSQMPIWLFAKSKEE
ncbi:alpha/beta hydrolase-fold protein [Blastopirellula marina]|uniref:Phospholipase n=1 Tax=Blastopirellula marina TaxID=124 RepID=A0A2S8F318_9BACT|nr:alpha/beta hydrolase-fold protein [Blastopirellula marina]PQO26562.1 hypothetical protein C5Y98_29685 [Blastopirellula marina]PTL40873.1 hypothetical protein C5Y97_29700 [Blastopirellula marina]